MHTGILILDSNCFKHLEQSSIKDRFRSFLDANNLEFRPTALNALELAKTRTNSVRERLLKIISGLSQDLLLLPDPLSFLRNITLAAISGEASFQTEASNLQWLLENASDLTPEIIDQVQCHSQKVDANFEDLHVKMRSWLRENNNQKQIESIFPSARIFLDSQWMRKEQLDTIIQVVWNNLELPGKAQIDLVLSLKAWRLYLEGLGTVIYRRVISSKQSKVVQWRDLSQLVYLAGRHRNLFITGDIAFLQTVQDVVEGRHSDVSVISWDDFMKSVT